MNGEPQSLILLEGVTKVFYTDEVETHALGGVHLDIKNGEFLSIAGPSGCGKSTLLSILGLLDSPSDGNYWINKQAVANLSLSDRTRIRNREIGFIFQAFNLIGDLTVFENVELPLTYRSMASAERKKRVQEVLERVGMAHRMKHYPSQLSGGQQQRVAVARALVGQPSILLADEPTGNLDSKNSEAVSTCCGNCTARARRSAWSRTIRVTPASPTARSIFSTAGSSRKQSARGPQASKRNLKNPALH